ncbi:tripartite tricarboxylate transporter TctB family protein [Halomonas denitrificans]|uniref:tripartite tricarboxylate transporter TctB family protein n=1 Tax=Halomonas denitrificans TaxID=370769 RepID=UPI001CD379C0|nr:tripartite tricarboxylate transporter TctB family protein [Halomonas denitrificans]MCA0975184.1 tripartite tricarboxylate transporter TctB family protein [Halomonas denitrificans]
MTADKSMRAVPAARSRASEVLLPVLFMAGAGLCLWETRQMSQLGAVFPAVISAGVMVAAALRLAQLLLRGVIEGSPAGGGSRPRRLALVGVMSVWALALPWLGFLLTGLGSFVALMAVAQYQQWTRKRLAGHLLAGCLLVAFFYVLFAVVLNVPLPTGRWLAA